MTTTRARSRSRNRGQFLWSHRWDHPGCASAFVAVTGRSLPGFSPSEPESPYGSGNLSFTVGDDATEVSRRRGAIAGWAGATRLVIAHQVHGNDVAQVDAGTRDTVTADGLVTTEIDLLLGVTVADCVPVMLVDQAAGVAGVAHAGRAGMVLGVVPAVLEAMRDLGATRVEAVVGPSICARCYEVPEVMRAEVAATNPLAPSATRTGTPSLDVAAGVLGQLHARAHTIQQLPGCTAESHELFSHRGSGGLAGRFAGYAGLLSGGPR